VGGEGDGPPTSRGLCREAGERRIGVLLEERRHGLDLQGEIKKSLEFIGSCISFLFSSGQNRVILGR